MNKHKLRKAFLSILAGCMVLSMIAYADGQAAILETYTGDSNISVYIKNIGGVSEDISVQIATTEANRVSVQVVSEMAIPMRTLVMVDNSLSIPSDDRDKIAQLLQNLISDRLNQEEISIAVFSEEVNVLVDYTNDYSTLKKAIDGITYQDQETYLTDVLYDLLSEKYVRGTEDIYCRILVISDGVDNKSLGYTKDELYSLLKDTKIPIYTIGCTNKKNNEELENMFALSRMTNVDYFLLEETEELLDITDMLNKDREIVKLSITPPEELLDGGVKSVKITLPDGTVLSSDITMPQQVYEKEVEASPMPTIEPEPDISPEPVIEEDAASDTNYLPFLIIGGMIALIIAITVVVVLLLKKNKRKVSEFESIDDNLLKELQSNIGNSDTKTEVISSFQVRNSEDGSTVMIWNQDVTYQVVLTDIHSPAKSFQVPLNKSIIIGRKSGLCDIALEYEKSVSGRHCEINVREGKFYVKDLQSSNGTYLNGSKVLTETEIYSGNTLKFGRLEMRFEVR